MYDLSPGITMRSTIPAYSYRHGLNFIPGIVKTRIDCYSGISNPLLIVMAPGNVSLHVSVISKNTNAIYMSMIYAIIKNDDLISTFPNVEMCIENVSTNDSDK